MNVKGKILKIMSLCLEINPPEVAEIGRKKTAVFFHWSPHCNSLEIYGYFHRWKKRADKDFDFAVYTDREPEKLDEIIRFLEGILEGEENAIHT